MSGDPRYEEALAAALGVLNVLENRPLLSRQEKLAQATFIVLDAIYRAQEGRLATTVKLAAPASRTLRVTPHAERRQLPPPH